MARCPDCNKFVSYDTDIEPEENDELSVSGDKNGYIIEGSFRRVLACGECGTDLREADIELSAEIENIALPDKNKLDPEAVTSNVEADPLVCPESEDGAHRFEVDSFDAAPTTDTEGRGRGMRTFYGVQVSARVICEKCEARGEATLEAREQASSFEEC